jgi:hypothetical protein
LTKYSEKNNVIHVMNRPRTTKDIKFIRETGFVKKGDIIPAVNHAAATMFANSDNALSWAGLKFLIALPVMLALAVGLVNDHRGRVLSGEGTLFSSQQACPPLAG